MSAPAIISSGTASGGPPVGGSGTTNTIPRWTGATTLGDSGLIDNGTAIYTTTRNVGIGTTSPPTRLQVNDGSFPAVSTATQRNIYTGTITAGYGGSIGFGGYYTGNTETTFSFIVGGKDNATAGDYAGHLQFWTRPNGGVYAERARIDSAGNVGIGTASPASALHVRNNTAGITLDSTLGSGRQYQLNPLRTGVSNAGFEIRDVTAGAAVISIDASQQVGIGTASPTGRLHVVGGTAAASTNGAPITIVAQNAGSGAAQNGGNIVLTPGSKTGTGTDGLVDLSSPSGTGLKLPAAPGNADTQTLDCYAEGTWTPTLAGFGGTNPTVTASYTRVGRLVTIAVQIDATGGNQYSMTLGTTTITTPAGMTANSICAVPVVDGGVANRGIASVWTTGIIYLPTVALTTASTFFVATYRV